MEAAIVEIPNGMPKKLVPFIVRTIVNGGDLLVDGESRALICLTPKAAAAIEAEGGGDKAEVNRHAVPDLLKKLIVDHGLKIAGVTPEGDMCWLTNNPEDGSADGGPTPGESVH